MSHSELHASVSNPSGSFEPEFHSSNLPDPGTKALEVTEPAEPDLYHPQPGNPESPVSKPFVFIEMHSVYSMCEGTRFPSELAQATKERGLEYISLCDNNGFYGLVRYIQEAKSRGLKPLIASRIEKSGFSIIVVPKNLTGYGKLSWLITECNLNQNFDPKEWILKNMPSEWVIITSDRDVCLEGKRSEKSGVYAEINVLQKDYRKTLLFARRNKIPPVLIYPVYFLAKTDFHLHRVLRAIKLNKTLNTLDYEKDLRSRKSYFPTPNYIWTRYSFMEDAILNTIEIAKKCYFEFPLGRAILPSLGNNSFERLKKICVKNLKKRYREITPEIKERLERELSLIREKGFADYFLIMHDLVRRCGYTCGRGSAAASLVSYLLFITHVDPVTHNLYFERFINKYRPDPPDIDVDFPWDERDNILRYIFQKYGTEHTAMVSNHITFSARSSLREVAKVYGVPDQEISKITKRIVLYYSREHDDFYQALVSGNGSVRERNHSPGFPSQIYRDAVNVHGRPRHLSVHCGGVVITPEPVSRYIPVERATKGVRIIQLEKDQAEEFGFIKLDILGNRSLGVVRDTLERINAHYGIKIRYSRFNPLRDGETIEMLAKGKTIGVFYVESPAMRQLQRKTGRGDYEHLVIHSSIIRPAANRYIKEYIERLRGKAYTPILPEMKELLCETYGIMCYQEDIMKIAMEVAGFNLAEANELRKVVSNKNKLTRKLELKNQFYENLRKRGVSRQKIDEIWSMIESFSGYSFCKPHSASYALLSFKACFLKAHFPAEFMGAVIKNGGGYYIPFEYISEARRIGLKIEKPEINASEVGTYGKKDTIYLGFDTIKGLSRKFAEIIISERTRNGPYKNLRDFIKRTAPDPSDITLLIKADCFRGIESYNQPQLLYLAHMYHKAYSRNHSTEPELFQLDVEFTPPELKTPGLKQKLLNEIEIFGYPIAVHPMELIRKMLPPSIIRAVDIEKYINKKIHVAGVLVTSKTVLTRTNELMQFISFEDETAIFETVFFPGVYKHYGAILDELKPYILYGEVQEEFGVVSLNVLHVKRVHFDDYWKTQREKPEYFIA